MVTSMTMMKMALAEVDKLPRQRHFVGKQRKKRQKVRQFRLMLGHVTQNINQRGCLSPSPATGEAILAFATCCQHAFKKQKTSFKIICFVFLFIMNKLAPVPLSYYYNLLLSILLLLLLTADTCLYLRHRGLSRLQCSTSKQILQVFHTRHWLADCNSSSLVFGKCVVMCFFFPALPSNVKALSNSQGSTLALLGTDSTANQRSKVLLKTKTTTRATVLASYHHKHTLATAPAGPSRSLRSFKMARWLTRNEEAELGTANKTETFSCSTFLRRSGTWRPRGRFEKTRERSGNSSCT